MSIRVLEVEIGSPYPHSFLDDLESFLWLILWSVVAHLDPKAQTTFGAQTMLNSMSDGNLHALASWKLARLFDCVLGNGARMKRALHTCENKWALDQTFTDAIVGLGGFFSNIYGDPDAPRRPAEAFSQVIDIIESALSRGSSK